MQMETIKGQEEDCPKPLTQYKFKCSVIHSGAIRDSPSEFVNRIKSDIFQRQMWKVRYSVETGIDVKILQLKYELKK
jgi:hypothetical protein